VRVFGNGRRTTALAAAHQAGFGSYAQFYRVFRQEAGHNPSALRTAAAHDNPRLADLVAVEEHPMSRGCDVVQRAPPGDRKSVERHP
jgi:AraC-like DNA-binding protein